MNTKQIAAEAAEQIETDVSDVIIDKELLTAIIQSAIEKAVSIAKDEWNEADYIANNDPTSRVAHASEPIIPDEIIDAANKVAHWAKINGWESGWCIGPVCDRAARGWRATR